MNKREIVATCAELCEKRNDRLKCISECCNENGVDPIEGIIIYAVEIESVNSPLYKISVK